MARDYFGEFQCKDCLFICLKSKLNSAFSRLILHGVDQQQYCAFSEMVYGFHQKIRLEIPSFRKLAMEFSLNLPKSWGHEISLVRYTLKMIRPSREWHHP